MAYFREKRCIELSTYYYLKTQIEASWTGISVVKSFNQAYKENLPVVAIRLESTDSERQEIGANTLWQEHDIYIDIFCTSDGQRLDLSDFIMDKLKDTWAYNLYTQASGAPETLVATSTNYKIRMIRTIMDEKIDFNEDVDRYDKFRHFIQIKVKKH